MSLVMGNVLSLTMKLFVEIINNDKRQLCERNVCTEVTPKVTPKRYWAKSTLFSILVLVDRFSMDTGFQCLLIGN